MISPKLITDALATVTYAGTKKNLIESEMLADQPSVGYDKDSDTWTVRVVLLFPRETDPFLKSTVKAAEAAILAHVGSEVDIKGNIAVKTAKDNPVRKIEHPLPGVKNIIAVSSAFDEVIIVWISISISILSLMTS